MMQLGDLHVFSNDKGSHRGLLATNEGLQLVIAINLKFMRLQDSCIAIHQFLMVLLKLYCLSASTRKHVLQIFNLISKLRPRILHAYSVKTFQTFIVFTLFYL